MYQIELKNVTAGYRSAKILNNISCTFSGGERISIAGPNGSGKTTLIRVLSGLLPYKGSILIHQDSSDNSVHKTNELSEMNRRSISSLFSIMPQFSGSYFEYTVEETVQLGRYIHETNRIGKESLESKIKVSSLLQELNLTDLKDRFLSELSGGQLQRVLLARTLAQDTPFLLLDEPVNHLDIRYQQELMQYLLNWKNSSPANTFVGVFHDLSLAKSISSRIIFLKDGQIAADGAPDKIITSSLLNDIYGIDIAAYMKKQLSTWNSV